MLEYIMLEIQFKYRLNSNKRTSTLINKLDFFLSRCEVWFLYVWDISKPHTWFLDILHHEAKAPLLPEQPLILRSSMWCMVMRHGYLSTFFTIRFVHPEGRRAKSARGKFSPSEQQERYPRSCTSIKLRIREFFCSIITKDVTYNLLRYKIHFL